MGMETALTMQAFGGGASVAGAYYTAQGQKTALKAEANIADINARMAELNAQNALIQGQKAVQMQRLKTAEVRGAQRAAIAANGMALDSETAMAIQQSTDIIGEVNADAAEADAINAAFGYRTQAVNLKNQALMARAGAKSISPLMSAGTQLLTSASQVATNQYLYTNVGGASTNTGRRYVDTSAGLPWRG